MPRLSCKNHDEFDLYSKEFDEFWSHYPRKVAKGKARQAYVKALKRALPSKILDGLQTQIDAGVFAAAMAAARRQGYSETHFVPHAATWLAAERWSDEIRGGPSIPRPEFRNGALEALAQEYERRHVPGPLFDGTTMIGHRDD